MVSEIAVRVLESIRGSPLDLVDLAPLWIPFVHTHAVADVSKNVTSNGSSPKKISLGIPKSLRSEFARISSLPWPSRRLSGCISWKRIADRRVRKQIALKLLGYHHYLSALDLERPQQRLWQRYGAMRDFRVLIVTANRQRVRSLSAYLLDREGYELAALTTLAEVQEKNPIFDGIWVNRVGAGRALVKSR